jgi:hypothetical protein
MNETSSTAAQAAHVSNTFVSSLRALRLGVPQSHGSLVVLPVYDLGPRASSEYLLLADAVTEGLATVTECDVPTVSKLQVVNRGELPVLILDAETVFGGRQTRTAASTMLVPPKTTFVLPTNCIEAARWRETTRAFAVGDAMHPSLRAVKSGSVHLAYQRHAHPVADQHRVWEEVAASHARAGTFSPTSSLQDAYMQRREELGPTANVMRCPDDGPIGIVGLIEGEARVADLFDRAETLCSQFPRLVRAYAFDAQRRQSNKLDLNSAQRLLHAASQARCSAYSSAGLGFDVRVEGEDVIGAALVHERVVVHTALFRREPTGVSTPGFVPPSTRARNFGA